jgi:hypothetical protein
MKSIANKYNVPLETVTGVFCALSPNNDYVGNLRGAVSLIEAWVEGHPLEDITVGTYNHCRDRAWQLLEGVNFLDQAKGPKIRSFYLNILDPTDMDPVTVDGHMYWGWIGKHGTMKEAKVTAKVYRQITEDVNNMARLLGLVSNQVQATLWFARKRINGVVYSPQFDMLDMDSGAQKTVFTADEIKPFKRKSEKTVQSIAKKDAQLSLEL